MSNKQYHYLIAGLPDLIFDSNKTPLSSKQFIDELSESITGDDLDLMKLYLWRYDVENVLSRLKDPNVELNPLGNLSSEELDDLFALVKEGSTEQLSNQTNFFLAQLIEAYKNETALIEGKSWEVQATELYFNIACSHKNTFVRKWFTFERDLSNFITATKCRDNKLSIENQLIGKTELTKKLIKSSSKDFGIQDELPMIEQIQKALSESNLLEQEKKTDLIKWSFLDEEVFFHYFTIEKIFAFLIKLSISERWIKLDKDTGMELFNNLLKQLENSYELPSEFSLN